MAIGRVLERVGAIDAGRTTRTSFDISTSENTPAAMVPAGGAVLGQPQRHPPRPRRSVLPRPLFSLPRIRLSGSLGRHPSAVVSNLGQHPSAAWGNTRQQPYKVSGPRTCSLLERTVAIECGQKRSTPSEEG